MLTRWLFLALVVVVALQRLWELRVSRAHEQQLYAAGAFEHAPGQMPWMTAVHTGWLVCSPLEVFLAERPFRAWLAGLALAVFLVGQALRIVAMRSLGMRWTVRVITPVCEHAPVSGGIYRYLRHPNYLGVVLEIAALPLVHGAWLCALVFSLANGTVLFFRIRAEEEALSKSSDWGDKFRARPRLFPSLFRR